jgi:predicted MPP superfamily phosphohydrolase
VTRFEHEPPDAQAVAAAEGVDAAPGIASEAPSVPAARARWKTRRDYMERHREKRLPDGKRHRRRFGVFSFLIAVFGRFLKLTGLYGLGERNALDIRVNPIEITLPDLPPAFDGYTLLQLTDLHMDSHAPATLRLIEAVDGLTVDAVVLTGDYRVRISGPFEQILPGLEALLGAVHARDGVFGILGNHDTVDMMEPFERLGVTMLANQTVTVKRDGASLHLVGIDDVHYYYTDQAAVALRAAPAGFKIALIHSPELVREAAAAGVSLYLAGHTHGGQICLPGGWPIITHMAAPRRYSRGLWRSGAMVGYTSTGAGTSGIPVRFNSRSEVALITLRRMA